MPTIKNIAGPFRFFFYSFDCKEQLHVHVQREIMACQILAGDHRAGAQSGIYSERTQSDTGYYQKQQKQKNGGMV